MDETSPSTLKDPESGSYLILSKSCKEDNKEDKKANKEDKKGNKENEKKKANEKKSSTKA